MLRDQVEAALAEMNWLGPTDDALRAVALKLAEEIDSARARADEFKSLDGAFEHGDPAFDRLRRLEAWCDVAKTVGMLGPRLRDVLKDLGGAPAQRKEMEIPGDEVTGRASRLTGLRSFKGGKSA
jgi:hypothetical protein